ncbi:MAG TPA: tripartite tricarboxylate transporter TctB family protein, partial [Methylomirabilota bacterium]|nr:tripartite tricarboxylate transporter TctB family protein [Methylomirabilota bacterium]
LALFALAGVQSLHFSLRDSLGPGPGFFPFWLSLVGGALAVALLVQVSRAPAGAAPVLPPPAARLRVLNVFLALVGAAALLGPVGFRLTMLLFCAYLLVALGVRRWWSIGLVAVVGSFGVFHVFYHWLKVPLPVGPLGL